MIAYLLLFLGLAILLVSGEALVKGAVGLAARMRVSTLVIGATVVSLGTSAPELFVSIQAAVTGHPEIAIGNVIGSNIANLGLVLGLVLVILPLQIEKDTIALDWPVMMGASLLFYLLAMDGTISFFEGFILAFFLVAYVIYAITKSRRLSLDDQSVEQDFSDFKSEAKKSLGFLALLIVGGSVGLVIGAHWFLESAIQIAQEFDVSEHIISVTLVAFGTSVPELFTSLVAAFRKQADISIGNLIGSNTFNILGILGVTAMVKEVEVTSHVLNSDLWWMLGISFILFPFFLYRKKLNQVNGIIFLLAYVLYVTMVILSK